MPPPLPPSATNFNPAKSTAADMLAALGVSHEQFSRHQELMRRSFLSPQGPSHAYNNSSLPYPLNLPPSYPTYAAPSASPAPTRHSRPPPLRHSASVAPIQLSNTPEPVKTDYARVPGIPDASCSKGKAKASLDAFMDSRQGTRRQGAESSSSDSDTSLRKVLALPQIEDPQSSDSCAPLSSSPPSSSPVRTPRESSPLRSMYAYPSASSPTPRPKRQSSTRVDASDPPYTLPPGPYSPEKPSWSLAALIGQAINASHSGALPLNDIYTYISTVYPHYNRRDQPWMSSVRHSLSVNDAFERVPDQEGSTTRRGRAKGMTRLKGGLWRIQPGHQDCFVGGNFVRKGAKGAGPGKNLGGRKRLREEEEQRSDKKSKAEEPRPDHTSSSRPSSRLASTSSSPESHVISFQSPHIAPTTDHSGRSPSVSSTLGPSPPPPLTTSQSMVASGSLLHDPFNLPPSSPAVEDQAASTLVVGSPGSPELPLAHMVARRNSIARAKMSSLEPGFELGTSGGLQDSPDLSVREAKDMEVNRDLFTRVLASTSSTYSSIAGPSSVPKAARLLFPPPFPSSPLPGSSSSPSRPTTPPPRPIDFSVTLSPARTPMSHRGLHMSPSRSLLHYKSSLEPEWKTAGRRTTPPPRDAQGGDEDDTVFSTPRRFLSDPSGSLQASPFRTPARPSRGYDPYDPNTLLADELESIRNANDPQESPGGFFGKEGRKLLYESPSVPGRSDWRFRNEL